MEALAGMESIIIASQLLAAKDANDSAKKVVDNKRCRRGTWSQNEDSVIVGYIGNKFCIYGRLFPNTKHSSALFYKDLKKFFDYFSSKFKPPTQNPVRRTCDALKRRVKEIRYINKQRERTYFGDLYLLFNNNFKEYCFLGNPVFKDQASSLDDGQFASALATVPLIQEKRSLKRSCNDWSLDEDKCLFQRVFAVFLVNGTLFPSRNEAGELIWEKLIHPWFLSQGFDRSPKAIKRRFKSLKGTVTEEAGLESLLK